MHRSAPGGGVPIQGGSPASGSPHRPQSWPKQPVRRTGWRRLRHTVRTTVVVTGIILAALILGLIGGAISGRL